MKARFARRRPSHTQSRINMYKRSSRRDLLWTRARRGSERRIGNETPPSLRSHHSSRECRDDCRRRPLPRGRLISPCLCLPRHPPPSPWPSPCEPRRPAAWTREAPCSPPRPARVSNPRPSPRRRDAMAPAVLRRRAPSSARSPGHAPRTNSSHRSIHARVRSRRRGMAGSTSMRCDPIRSDRAAVSCARAAKTRRRRDAVVTRSRRG